MSVTPFVYVYAIITSAYGKSRTALFKIYTCNLSKAMIPSKKLNTIKAMMRRSIFFLKRREGAVGVSSREGSFEGSLGAVNRTDSNISVDFNGVSTVIRKTVSDSFFVIPHRLSAEKFSEFGWYRG